MQTIGSILRARCPVSATWQLWLQRLGRLRAGRPVGLACKAYLSRPLVLPVRTTFPARFISAPGCRARRYIRAAPPICSQVAPMPRTHPGVTHPFRHQPDLPPPATCRHLHRNEKRHLIASRPRWRCGFGCDAAQTWTQGCCRSQPTHCKTLTQRPVRTPGWQEAPLLTRTGHSR